MRLGEEGPAKAGAGDDTEWTNRGVGSETIRGGGPANAGGVEEDREDQWGWG